MVADMTFLFYFFPQNGIRYVAKRHLSPCMNFGLTKLFIKGWPNIHGHDLFISGPYVPLVSYNSLTHILRLTTDQKLCGGAIFPLKLGSVGSNRLL